MGRCLPNRALLLCATGEGTHEQFLHIATCHACQERYLRCVRDLEAIERVLREPPPLGITTPHVLRPHHWLSVTTTIAIVIVLVWGGWRVRQSSQSPLLVN